MTDLYSVIVVLDKDKEDIISNTPQKFQEMIDSVGVEQAIKILVQLLLDT